MFNLDYFYQKAGKTIVIDTNLLLLILVGSIDEECIGKIKGTKMFSKGDFRTLIEVLDPFKRYIITPNVLTEISNLVGKEKDYYKRQIFSKLIEMMSLNSFEEKVIESKNVIMENSFCYLGLTDVGIIKLAERDSYGVITKDYKLCEELDKNGIPVLNFTKLMEVSQLI